MDSETYQTRLIDNACTGSAGCRRPTVDGTSQCKRHLKAARRRSKLAKRRQRDRLAAQGKCRSCGTPRKPKQRCAVCAAKRPERIRVGAVHAAVNGDPFRRDNDGWKRYRGKGRRGAPGAAASDDQDLVDATKALERGRQALAYARSPEVQALPKIQRAGVRNEALAYFGRVVRTVEEVAARNRGRTAAADGAEGTWTYGKPADAAEVAQARVGEYVYAPPIDPPGRKDPGGRRAPPDLGPLRAALAARGLALAPEGAFYWLIVELRVATGQTAPQQPGATP